jgi:flagellar hook protein FlgE
MTFNTALSGLRAANSDLRVTGNNIANASTTGFKLSRAEFGDVYASSALGGGSNPIGSGVLLADVAQQFEQGTISFTDRSLDVAINGNGFFVLSDGGARSYTRAGVFGVDAEGYIVANNGGELQGYTANAAGTIVDGVQTSLRLQTTNQPPNQTTAIETTFNVDAGEEVLLEQFHDSRTNGAGIGQIIPAAAAAAQPSNGYTLSTVEIIDTTNLTGTPDVIDFSSLPANPTASQIAAFINGQNSNVSATAITRANLTLGAVPLTFQDGLLINGNQITGTTVDDVVASIDRLPNMTATVSTTGVITVTSTVGDDLRIEMAGADTNNTGNTVDIESFRIDTTDPDNPTPVTLDTQTIGDGVGAARATIGGEVLVSLDYPYQLANAGAGNIFGATIPNDYQIDNEFDPADPDTYNHATSMTVYDSQGNAHVMTQYFVKQDDLGGQNPNLWAMYVMIDGNDVGTNDTAGNPMPARFDLQFNQDGSLNTSITDAIAISNWTPLGPDGQWNGAEVAPNSDFTIDISGSTQVGGAFAVGDLSQDGYSEGQLTNIEIAESGIVQARFTNGQTQVLGQVILANFANTQGLTPIGDTAWRESFASGPAIYGVPQAGNLGSLQSGALEDSNVELSEQLVNLIIAQRNYQANAKTIETANQVTQTIINLR